jgi:hypothetical protein
MSAQLQAELRELCRRWRRRAMLLKAEARDASEIGDGEAVIRLTAMSSTYETAARDLALYALSDDV